MYTSNNSENWILRILLYVWIIFWTLLIWFGSSLVFEAIGLRWVLTLSGIICSILTGAYFYVVLSIPQRLVEQFDKFKNKIAHNQYKNIEEFQIELSKFLVNFFNYPGANISGVLFSIENFGNTKLNMEQQIVKEKIARSSAVISFRGDLNRNLIYVPIIIKDQKLGSLLLYTQGFVIPYFKKILSDFENNHLDDQLMHLIKAFS